MFFLVFNWNNLVSSFTEPKKPANIFAFSCPICLMPIENINLSNVINLDLIMAFFKLLIEVSPHPSS